MELDKLGHWRAAVFGLVTGALRTTRFRWYSPPSDSGAHEIPGMPGMTLVCGESEDDPALSRLARRASARAAGLCDFLESDELSPGKRAIHEARGDRPDAAFVYSELDVRGSTEFVAVQRLSRLRPSFRCYSDVTLLTGHCLFSSRSLRLHTSRGTVAGIQRAGFGVAAEGIIEDISVDSRLSLYELETCARLARLVAAIRDQIDGETPIVLSQPRTQYQLHLLDSYQNGNISLALLRRWIELVDERCAQVAERFLTDLRSACRYSLGNLTVLLTDSLSDFDPFLREEIRAGEVPGPSEVLRRLAANDPTFALLSGLARPRSWAELGHLGHTAEYLRRSITIGTRPRRLLIAVEDPIERRLLIEAKALAARIREHSPAAVSQAIAVYPLERVFVHDGARRTQVHHHDPGFGAAGPSGRMVYPPELITQLHH
ncbi:hypothetical protein GCM10023321_41190 [Pseudonocardia eucalypti]|uniref:Uncharacterized protein n=1 Tax=Pseudonocardia eucalypti TaxID=648755 RepID=A0ABP9QCP2_9PSEU|nr:hypothetical protein [Pseudonocardia eucalypti]